MAALNMRLDPNSWDIVIDRGVERVEGLEHTAQMVRCRLQTVLGEWSPRPNLGLPWFDTVFTKAPDISLIQAIVTDEIKKIKHVRNVLQIELNVDKSKRTLNISFTAESDWGDIESKTTIGV